MFYLFPRSSPNEMKKATSKAVLGAFFLHSTVDTVEILDIFSTINKYSATISCVRHIEFA